MGTTGSVVAFDREARAIEAARVRAQAAGWLNIDFVVTTEDAMPEHRPFDAAIGRYILVHQPDPVAMIRRAAGAVRSGGIVAFHEIALYGPNEYQCLPRVELLERVSSCLGAAFEVLLPHYDVAGRLVACFEDAGLPTPHLIWECIAGDYTSPIARWLALSYRNLLPHITRVGIAPADQDDPATLPERLEAAVAAVRGQVVSRPQSCGWAMRP